MIRIFAYIRRVLALDKAARGIAAIAAQVVEEEFLPRLSRQLAGVHDDRERARIEALISDYEKYAKPGTHEYRDLENVAEAAVVSGVRKFHLSPSYEDEVTSMVVQDFFVPTVAGGKTLKQALESFPVETAAKAYDFTRWFNKIMTLRVHTKIRDMKIRQKEDFNKKDDAIEEHPGSSVIDRLRAPGRSPLEDVEEREERKDEDEDEDIQVSRIKKQMSDYVKGHSKDDSMRALYDSWMRGIELHGPYVNLNRDVYPALEQTYNISRSGLNERFMQIKRLIERFFNEELGIRLTDALKKKLHIGAVEVLTFECFRRRFAAWMLCIDVP